MGRMRHRYRPEAVSIRIHSQSELNNDQTSSTYAAPSLREMIHALF